MASIDERGENNWRIRIYGGRDPGTGKKRYIVETVHGGRRDAQRRARQIQTQVESGGYVEPSRMTLGQYLSHWLENTAGINVRHGLSSGTKRSSNSISSLVLAASS